MVEGPWLINSSGDPPTIPTIYPINLGGDPPSRWYSRYSCQNCQNPWDSQWVWLIVSFHFLSRDWSEN